MTDYLYPKKEDFFNTYSRLAPVSLFLIRAKESELFARYIYERPVLDIGCGEASFAKNLFNGQIDAGIDINEKNAHTARKSRAYKEVYCAKAEDIPFAGSTFRTVISNCVLEHVQDIDRSLREIHRVLMPGGLAYLSVATPLFSESMSFGDVVNKKFGVRIMAGVRMLDYFFHHNHCLSAAEWMARINRAGLVIKETHPYLSPQLLHLMGGFFVFSAPSFIWKRTMNRWRLFPQLDRPKILMKFIRRYYEKTSDEAACFFFVVSKG